MKLRVKSKERRLIGHKVYEARLELMLSLYRLSHLKSEIHVEEESVETFSKIVTQFKRRPALSLEQDVSLSVFKMSLADHQLRLTKLKADEEKLFQGLMVVTRLSKDLISKNLPPAKLVWPSVKSEVPEVPTDEGSRYYVMRLLEIFRSGLLKN